MLSAWFYDELPVLLKRGKRRDILHRIQNTLFRIHGNLKKYGDAKGIRLGTTVSAVLVTEKWYIVFWLGDTHVYRTGKKLKRLTIPHTQGGGINRCLGMGSFRKADCITGRAVGGGFFITSDGMMGTVSEADLQGVTGRASEAGRESVRKGLDTLVKTALARGEGDNISSVYLKLVR